MYVRNICDEVLELRNQHDISAFIEKSSCKRLQCFDLLDENVSAKPSCVNWEDLPTIKRLCLNSQLEKNTRTCLLKDKLNSGSDKNRSIIAPLQIWCELDAKRNVDEDKVQR